MLQPVPDTSATAIEDAKRNTAKVAEALHKFLELKMNLLKSRIVASIPPEANKPGGSRNPVRDNRTIIALSKKDAEVKKILGEIATAGRPKDEKEQAATLKKMSEALIAIIKDENEPFNKAHNNIVRRPRRVDGLMITKDNETLERPAIALQMEFNRLLPAAGLAPGPKPQDPTKSAVPKSPKGRKKKSEPAEEDDEPKKPAAPPPPPEPLPSLPAIIADMEKITGKPKPKDRLNFLNTEEENAAAALEAALVKARAEATKEIANLRRLSSPLAIDANRPRMQSVQALLRKLDPIEQRLMGEQKTPSKADPHPKTALRDHNTDNNVPVLKEIAADLARALGPQPDRLKEWKAVKSSMQLLNKVEGFQAPPNTGPSAGNASKGTGQSPRRPR